MYLIEALRARFGGPFRRVGKRALDTAASKVNRKLATDYERLVALTHAAKCNGDLDELMRYIRGVLVEDFGFDRAGVFSHDAAAETMRGV